MEIKLDLDEKVLRDAEALAQGTGKTVGEVLSALVREELIRMDPAWGPKLRKASSNFNTFDKS